MIYFFKQKYLNMVNDNPDKLLVYYKMYITDLQRIYSYYRNIEKTVNNNHILVKILKNINININNDLFDILMYLKNIIPYTEKYYDISSPTNKGKIINESIVGNSKSVLCSRKYNIDYFNLNAIWKKITPIKVLKYEGYSLNMPHPTNNNELLMTTGMEVDLFLLCLQYYYWCKERISLNKDINPQVFIYQYPLTNMIGNILDLSIMNRIIYNNNILNFENTHPFAIVDKHEQIDYLLEKHINKMKHKFKKYEELCYNFKLPFNNNVLNLYKDKDSLITNNNRGSEFILRNDIVNWLILNNNHRSNGVFIKDLTLYLKLMKTNKNNKELDLTSSLNYEEIYNKIGVKL